MQLFVILRICHILLHIRIISANESDTILFSIHIRINTANMSGRNRQIRIITYMSTHT